MDKQLIKLIERLDNELDNLFNRLDLNIGKLQNEIYQRLIQFTNKLKISKGNLVASVENLKYVNSFQKELSDLVNDTKYMPNVLKDFINGITISTKYVNDYFSILSSSFDDKTALFKEIRNFVINETTDLLLGSGLQANLLQPIKSILQQNITTSASFKDLQTQLELFLDNNTKRYVKQITNDAILGYERNYMISISNDLGFEHYLYQGTKIETSRSFCKSRIGNFYTKKEVEQWAYIDWNGKRQGTNKDTIFYFAGGYNCRHRLLPVSKEIYNDKIN